MKRYETHTEISLIYSVQHSMKYLIILFNLLKNFHMYTTINVSVHTRLHCFNLNLILVI